MKSWWIFFEDDSLGFFGGSPQDGLDFALDHGTPSYPSKEQLPVFYESRQLNSCFS
jgi:hypothetical protein